MYMKSLLHKKTYGLIALLISLLFGYNSIAQSQHTKFLPVEPEELSNSARCFFKDSKGFMWIGTSEGLIRYDGTNLYSYEHNPGDKTTISHNSINVIIEDSHQKLWIGTAKGLCLYDREKDNFINIDSFRDNKNSVSNRFITCLSVDQYDRLWIGTHGGGVNVYDPANLTFTYFIENTKDNTTSLGNYVNSFLYVDNQMWCGTKGGLRIFDATDLVSTSLPFNEKEIPQSQINQMIQDKTGNIWLATQHGELIKASRNDGYYSFRRTISRDSIYSSTGNNILTLCSDSKGNLWIGGENSGLNYLDTKKNKISYFGSEDNNLKKLPTNSIRSVYIDDSGLTWIATFDKGVYLINNNAEEFDSYNWGDFKPTDLENKSVKGFAEDKNGNIWIVSEGLGLIKLNSETGKLQRCDNINFKLNTKHLTSIISDSNDNLWIGTAGKGLYKVNFQNNDVKNYSLQSGGFGDDNVSCLYIDKKGTIWAGTLGSGLFYFDEETQRFTILCEKNKPNFIEKTNYISSVLEDSDGILWVGTMYGLYELTKVKNNSFIYRCYLKDDLPDGRSRSGIQTLLEDPVNGLWIGTTDNGLNIKSKKTSQFKVFQKEDGLPSNFIKAMEMDSVGNIWISGNMGISKLNPKTNVFTNYTTSDGLASNNFYNNASLHSSTGKLFFGNNNGFNAFYPDSIQSNTSIPELYFTDLKINNELVGIGTPSSPLEKHISLTPEIELSHKQRSFTIDFAAINYGQSSHFEYCYMLEGFDKTWNCIGKNHSATYTNIDPGEYVFLAKAEHDGIWNKTPKRLKIVIRPILWKTWWAMTLYTVLIIITIYFLIRIRTDRINIKNQLAMERLARERENELIESKTQFFTDISHEFRTPLSLISMPLENLIAMEDLPSTVKGRLNTIQANSDKMMKLVNELMDFNKMESAKLKLHIQEGELVRYVTGIAAVFNDLAIKRNIHFGVHSMFPSLNGWFDHDKMEKILVNILSNAFRFTSDNGQINIIINSTYSVVGEKQVKSNCLELSIIDNGIGISENELPFIFDKFYQAKSSTKINTGGTGIGLSLTKGLVELHQGNIKVESLPGHQTQFIILIPIDRKVFFNEDIYDIPVSSDNLNTSKANNYNSDDWDKEDDQLKPHILIAEDNDELRNYISLEFRNQFNVLEAKDGKQALEIALEKSPDLIISDILMPVKNGIELCNEIKSNLETSHIPFIMLTAKTTVNDQIEGIETGADVYITKPFSFRFLVAQVNQIIESRQKLYSQFSQDVFLLPNKVTSNEIDQEFLQKAIEYIIENLQDSQLGVDSIAGLFNLSRMQVYRKIKALTGKSIVNFIRMVRIKQALKLMDTQKFTLTEIAFRTGFNSASYFTRCFKDEYGKAPSDYLEQNQ